MNGSSYFAGLVNMVDGGEYIHLLRILNREHFFPSHYMDENRVQEVKETLRELIPFPPKTEYVSIFEILVLLAHKYEDICKKYGEPDRTATYFWTIITNCGLNRYDDLYFKNNREICTLAIKEFCVKFNTRTYGRDGTGSPFPIKNSNRDMRKIELFYQLCMYIQENNESR